MTTTRYIVKNILLFCLFLFCCYLLFIYPASGITSLKGLMVTAFVFGFLGGVITFFSLLLSLWDTGDCVCNDEDDAEDEDNGVEKK